jgi:RNA polymerase primary sigma factor
MSSRYNNEWSRKLKKEYDNVILTRNYIAKRNMALLKFITRRASDKFRSVPFDDLFQEGYFGLIRAIERFEVGRSNKFSTYCSYWINNSHQRYVDSKGYTIRTPHHIWETNRRMKHVQHNIARNEGEDESKNVKKISEILKMKEKKIESVIKWREIHVKSMNEPMNSRDGDEDLSVESIMMSNDMNPEEKAQKYEVDEYVRSVVKKVVKQLPERNCMIVQEKLGFGSLTEDRTLQEIGEEYGLSRERVRQIVSQAMSLIECEIKKNKEIVFGL